MTAIYRIILQTTCEGFLEEVFAQAWECEAESLDDLAAADFDFGAGSKPRLAVVGVNFSDIGAFFAFVRAMRETLGQPDHEQLRAMEIFADGQRVDPGEGVDMLECSAEAIAA
jgi:hypothetical protein